MSVKPIQRLGIGLGTPIVPEATDYSDASSGWNEIEHRADLPGTQTIAGAWEGQPGWVVIKEWPYHEVCVILTGRVAIESTTGDRVEFGTGESFVVPKGFNGTWHTLEPTQKIFVGVDAK
jgi:hypothetical protein